MMASTEQQTDDRDILSRLRFAILSLDLVPGEPVSERALESQFQVSRTPIREALFHLVRDGLVVRDGRSYAIAPFDMAEIDEVFAFRDIVEPQAVRLAARFELALICWMSSLSSVTVTISGVSEANSLGHEADKMRCFIGGYSWSKV